MENNTTAVDTCLDQLLQQVITEKEAREMLRSYQVDDVDNAIALHRQAAATIQRYRILQQVQGVHQAYLQQRGPQQHTAIGQPTAKVVKLRPTKWILRIAALLVLGMGATMGYQYATNSGNKLYGELYHPYNIGVHRTAPVPDEGINQVVALYEAKNFTGLTQHYAQLATPTTRETFFAALAHSELKQYDKAIALFEALLAHNKDNGNRLYNDDAEYYVGLAYLQQQQYAKAYDILNAIRNEPSHTYHEAVGRWLMMRLQWLK
jgi:tetratricopeptide (TPR) repeat protein